MAESGLLKEEAPHYLGHRKRLRQKFLKSGIGALSEYEVLEMLLGMTIARKDVKPLAKALLKRFGSLAGLLDAPFKDLLDIKGLGEGTAASLMLVKETSTLYLREKSRNICTISSPSALIDYCRSAMEGLRDEQFRVIFLNSKNEIIEDEVISEGTIDQTTVYPRKVIERTIHHGATSIILVHNHPSGHTNPSSSDREITRIIREAASSIQVKVHDHLIIGKKGFYSFTEEGIL